METIAWEDFAQLDIRVGRIVGAEVFAAARKPAYLLRVDFGPEIGERTSSAQLTDLYRPEELVGRLVVGVVNLGTKQIGPLRSECLITGFPDDQGAVVLCVPEREVSPGARLF
ncbi:MAG: tRNA-binding protein [Desulfobulbus sp.]|jgi:tRNA-binding protein|nr:tRNA-binding protein [Desulfobulbus sp.]